MILASKTHGVHTSAPPWALHQDTVFDNAACNLLRAISLVGLAFTPKGCSDRISPPFSKIGLVDKK